MRYYKVVTPDTYDPSDVSLYVPFLWTKVPQDVLNVPGTLFTVYSSDSYEALFVILGKPCRQRKTTSGYQVTDQEVTLYI